METGRNRHLEQIFGLITVESKDAPSIKIVDITILHDLFSMIPGELLQKCIASYLERVKIPDIESPQFGPWLKGFRKKLGLTQRGLLEKLTDTNPNLKFSSSDIGNLETGKRLKDYGPSRRERFKKTLLRFRAEMGENTTGK